MELNFDTRYFFNGLKSVAMIFFIPMELNFVTCYFFNGLKSVAIIFIVSIELFFVFYFVTIAN
ncbi:hypothetical protein AB674_02850 [Flavobacterium sp. ABG]|nr:hypothetical protein AB674_02850 [Flavobacterium sp. ABG]